MKTKTITRTIKETLSLISNNNNFNMEPVYQRGFVWSSSKQQEVIDTVVKLKGFIPTIILRIKTNPEGYEVVDGKQRLITLQNFYDNKLKIRWDNGKGKETVQSFKDICKHSPKFKTSFENFELFFIELENATDREVDTMFFRLQKNSKLNPAEMRHTLDSNVRFMVGKLLREYNKFFIEHVNEDNKRGAYEDIIAKLFFHLDKNDVQKINPNDKNGWGQYGCRPTSKNIENFYEEHKNDGEKSEKYDKKDYYKRAKGSLKFAKDIFKNINFKDKFKITKTEFITIVLLCDYLILNTNIRFLEDKFSNTLFEFLKRKKDVEKKSLLDDKDIDNDMEFYRNSLKGENKVSERIYYMHKYISTKLTDLVTLDPLRIFPKEMRETIASRANFKCQGCKIELHEQDAEIHHIKEWAGGGRTVPENGSYLCLDCHSKQTKHTNYKINSQGIGNYTPEDELVRIHGVI